jgi:hypothetical protein
MAGIVASAVPSTGKVLRAADATTINALIAQALEVIRFRL